MLVQRMNPHEIQKIIDTIVARSIKPEPTFDNNQLHELCAGADFERDNEVGEIEKAVKTVVEKISKRIGEEDPLFKSHILCSGSFYEDLKIDKPDEFDYMLCLEDLSEPGVRRITDIPEREVEDPGYSLVRVEDAEVSQRWHSYVSTEKNLKSNAMLERFHGLVSKALEEITLPPKLKYNGSVELRKIPVTFQLTWHGEKYRDLEISVDLPICIHFEGWPYANQLNYYPRGHPVYEYLKEAQSHGYHLVASSVGESGEQRPSYWRLSFSMPEGILLRQILENLGSVHRASIMALKVLRQEYEHHLDFIESDEGPEEEYNPSYVVSWVMHSYVIKTMFFYEWYQRPDEQHWGQDKLAERVRAILKRLHHSFATKDIRSFWVSEYKLFNFKARKHAFTIRCRQQVTDLIKAIK